MKRRYRNHYRMGEVVRNFRNAFYVSSGTTPQRTITKRIQREILARDDGICQYCGVPVEKPHIDHIIPQVMGGNADMFNVVAACQKCNTTKNASVWVPKNLIYITEDFPEWGELVLRLSNKETKTVRLEFPNSQKDFIKTKSDELGISAAEYIRQLIKKEMNK